MYLKCKERLYERFVNTSGHPSYVKWWQKLESPLISLWHDASSQVPAPLFRSYQPLTTALLDSASPDIQRSGSKLSGLGSSSRGERLEHGKIERLVLITTASVQIFLTQFIKHVRPLGQDLENPSRGTARRILRRKEECEQGLSDFLIRELADHVRRLLGVRFPRGDSFVVSLGFHHMEHPVVYDAPIFESMMVDDRVLLRNGMIYLWAQIVIHRLCKLPN
ncbi:hypothetical protein LCP9604111_3817 [Penicillium roqueforti]|uniref:uncharacterized protein n=1 Tax=Penicillium roqueforti TaxID=5082 RepID=UPI00190CC695|nr:uncharacterized protein LCP9604111_3817 [Penicillium roqueforti]KAF9250301.1 hypothetical protein LCP9604111_3817 [Penicillium roqueforti]